IRYSHNTYNTFYYLLLMISICFFFQAEDGIRDRNVTGVQTCALPISVCPPTPVWREISRGITPLNSRFMWETDYISRIWPSIPRSEERRVGKESRARWAPNQ